MSAEELTTRDIVIAGVAVVGAAALAYGISKLFSWSGERKTMVAPGRGDGARISREVFEKDTASYFRSLRKK